MDRNNVVLYDPVTAALFLDGGWPIIICVIIAALFATYVHTKLDKLVARHGFWHRQLTKIAAAVFFGTLFVMHLANTKGWI